MRECPNERIALENAAKSLGDPEYGDRRSDGEGHTARPLGPCAQHASRGGSIFRSASERRADKRRATLTNAGHDLEREIPKTWMEAP